MAKKKVNVTSNKKFFYVLLLFIATIFMGIGYASVNGVLVNIDGVATVLTQDVVHITSAIYTSNNGAVVDESSINGFSATTLDSTITLGNNSSSTITYTITIYNETNDDYIYTGTSFSAPDFYDNTNITFDPSGIAVGYKLDAKTSKTFTVTFKYAGSNTSNPVLNSYISFDFEKYYTITYQNINTSGHNYPTYILDSENTKNITFSGDVPFDVSITPTVNYNYTYNTTSGTLTLNNVKKNITIDRYYKITYNLNGGTNPNGQPTKYLHGANITILDPTQSNKTFDGWYDNAEFTGEAITNTNGITQDLVLYAKWIGGSSENAATYIVGLTENAPTNTTNIITVTSPDSSCTNTFAYDGTSDNNLRYVGADPCNYVKFNCDTNGNCETWRIIGVMNGVDTNPVLKIVKNDNSSTRAWNSKNNNTWDSSAMKSYLNNDYLNTFNNNVINNYALSVQWRIGAISYNGTLSNVYNEEKASSSTAAYVGLVYFSDYSYATSGTSNETRNSCLNTTIASTSFSSTCYNNNYLFLKNNNTGQNQWTIDRSSQGNSVIYISNSGKSVRGNATSQYYYRPVIYLKSNIKIKTDVGDGSLTHPYELTTN